MLFPNFVRQAQKWCHLKAAPPRSSRQLSTSRHLSTCVPDHLFKMTYRPSSDLRMLSAFSAFHNSGGHLFHSASMALHGYPASEVDPATAVSVTFVDRDGNENKVLAPPGKSLLEVAHANDIDLEGACEGSLACSTCHVYLDDDSFAKLEEPCDDEYDMLDLAFALTEKSRLGCQIKVSPELEGMTVTLPPATRNMAVDGYVPKPH